AAVKDDADALGRFLFFEKKDVRGGVLLLTKCKDSKLADAAAKDLKADSTAPVADILAAGDTWWRLAEGTPGADKVPLLMTAGAAYNRTLGDLSGLELAKYELR